jgi:hypothetical protein
LLIDIAVPPRGNHGLAARSDDMRGRLQNDVDVLLMTVDVRAALDVVKRELYAEVRRCADSR